MKCPKCDYQNPDDTFFCGKCGIPLKPSKDLSVTKTIRELPKELKKGAVIAGKYKVLHKLGEGGMGVVYKAKDTRLDRTVALKFLSSELIRNKEAQRRFFQEAKAAAALNHPQICTIYEVDEEEGQTFIAMEYVEGQSLKDLLRKGPLRIEEAKDTTIQIAEGLKEAHEKGIVHRDIKPANIMLTEKGQAKITDFGLAKLSGGVDLTKTSAIMGTVAYMSPEQAKGEEVDHRTDIWSLGAMLYEMLSGDRPFQKSQEQALIYAILNDKPTPLSLIRSDIPSHIEQVIEKALAKKASERYQNIQDLIQDLKLSIAFPKAEKSIVVLPFENLSPDPDQEYFSDGLTEEIITDLSKIHSLRVISRNSAMMFKGTRKATKIIGRELDVEYVLEGSVRKAGNNLRIIAQLIDAASDAHVWAERYTGTLDDVFDIQEKVSRSIADALKLKLTVKESDRISEKPIANVVAYEYFLQAKREVWSFNQESLAHALQLTNQALDIVGENALLYATRALIYWQYHNAGFRPDEDTLRQADADAVRALELDTELSQGHWAKGAVVYTRGELQTAARNFKQAAELEAGGEALVWLSLIHAIAGKMLEARRYGDHAVSLDPLNILVLCLRGLIEIYGGDFKSAISWLQRGLEVMPSDPMTKAFCAVAHLYAGNREESTALFDQLAGADAGFISSLSMMWMAALRADDLAFQKFSTDLQAYAKRDKELSWLMADCHAIMGQIEAALSWLANSMEMGLINERFFSEFDPFLAPLRDNRRFQVLMDRAQKKQQEFTV